ncbi:AlpA family transcriptional regulator [Novosphingobium sp. HII-3]|uniref:helix-turn-helix transcriptional regulator n=1 Tax=Novosphingobium sp. HII-3 TaxID=2075565 RepID=UPI000CDA5E4B|nr:helix-turn-helix domain-containing protein [Novosphingobium sp. HII-3]
MFSRLTIRLARAYASAPAMLTAKQVCEICGGVTDMTLHRWLKDERLGFPKPFYVLTRRYFDAADVRAWWADRTTVAPAPVGAAARNRAA